MRNEKVVPESGLQNAAPVAKVTSVELDLGIIYPSQPVD